MRCANMSLVAMRMEANCVLFADFVRSMDKKMLKVQQPMKNPVLSRQQQCARGNRKKCNITLDKNDHNGAQSC